MATAALASCASAPQAPEKSSIAGEQPVLTGTVIEVVDGDTLRVQLGSGPIRVRLHSIDAPERNQPWGPEATVALTRRIDRRQVALEVIEQDRYDRLVADVYQGGENVNAWMVKLGHAWAYRHYLDDANYCRWEGAARIARHGLWSLPPGTWQAPWELRHAEMTGSHRFTDYSHETVERCIAEMSGGARNPRVVPDPVPTSPKPPQACRIKGNSSENGRIYHVPGSRDYDRTVIDVSKGERWFCTEEEARKAGWRPPRD